MVSLGIRGRLFMGFSLLIMPVMILMILFLFKIHYIDSFTKRLVNVVVPTQRLVGTLDTNVYQSQMAEYQWLLLGDPASKENLSQVWKQIRHSQEELNKLATNWTNQHLLNRWNAIKILYPTLEAIQTKIIHLPVSLLGMDQNTKGLLLEEKVAGDKITELVTGSAGNQGGIFQIQVDELTQDAQQILSDVSAVQIIIYVVLVSITLLSIIISILIARTLLLPLNNAISIAKRIAQGERTIEFNSEAYTNDETGQLLAALSAMQESIRDKEEKLRASEIKTRDLFEAIVTKANIYSEHSSKVSAGDLTKRLDIQDDDEMATLGKDLNIMTEGLAAITRKITEASRDMSTSLEAVQNAADMQSSGVAEQASSINEITASLEEIDKSTAQTMDKARILGQIAEKTSQKGQQGLVAVEQSIDGMVLIRDKVQLIASTILDLSHKTQQVGEITAVVNTIALQSKMLALNASIEASKAGEAGKGFAVVAAEVKDLAEQSAESTTQVQKILEDIRHSTEQAVIVTEEGIKGVDNGTQLVGEMGEIVHSLTDAINETMIACQQIEAAVRQESLGIEQITTGMSEINQVTASFVNTVKKTTQSIKELSAISKNIKDYVDIYKI